MTTLLNPFYHVTDTSPYEDVFDAHVQTWLIFETILLDHQHRDTELLNAFSYHQRINQILQKVCTNSP